MRIKLLICLVLLFFINIISYGQTTEIIHLQYDTSGYSTTNKAANKGPVINNSTASANDTIPTIKGEMNVNSSGALTYALQIDVLKGLNNFQPNLTLAYSSQAGNGQAGWGWNIMGISKITKGGKSKYIDGLTIGVQNDGTDPYYLDGQRLLSSDGINFVTEKYSKIKITGANLINSNINNFSFIVQYTDGKIAKYKELVTGQHYISVLIDAYDNEIHYNYIVINNVPYINTISYGGTDVSTDKFSIIFSYLNRNYPVKAFRNGQTYINEKVISEINVASSYLQSNNGLYRKYKLTYDYIQSNTTERLIKIEVQNELNQALKPLEFGYNTLDGTDIYKSSYTNSGYGAFGIGLENVAIGDFYNTGAPIPIIENKATNNTYTINSTKSGFLGNYQSPKRLFNGRCIYNNSITENDQLITLTTDYIGDVQPNSLPTEPFTDRLTFKFQNLLNGDSKIQAINLTGGIIQNIVPQWDDSGQNPHWNNVTTSFRDKVDRKILTNDFNNDGLTDVLIFEKSNLSRPQKIYFAELGFLPAGDITPTIISSINFDENSDIYEIEYDGDGLPDLMFVNKSSGVYSIYKINLSNSTLELYSGQQNVQLSNFTDKTPLIFGDFNGDGLADFITPQKVYSLDGSSAGAELNKMENDSLLWWEYIGTGNGFIKTQKDYTQQKLAYMSPSQRDCISGSFWGLFWSGSQSYDYSEYAMSTVLPMDINNDGKTDLMSFRKFGRAKYHPSGELYRTEIQNLNDFYVQAPPTTIHACRNVFTGFVRQVNSSNECLPTIETYIDDYVQNNLQIIVNPNNANKVFFHITKTDSNGNPTLQNLDSTIPLDQTLISPMTILVNLTFFNKLNNYYTGVMLYDPIVRNSTYLIANNKSFVESQLQQVDNGTPITQKIEYSPMSEFFNTSAEKVYASENLNLSYPLFIHKNIGIMYLVNKIHTLFDDTILTKEYRYRNGIQHLNGKGFLGFQKTMYSDLYESEFSNGRYTMKNFIKGTFWTVNTNDPTLENSLLSTSYGSLDDSSVFSKTITSSQQFNMGNHRYLILPTQETTTDYLKNISISKSYQYDSSADLNLLQVNTDNNQQSATEEKLSYKPEFSNGDHYFFGVIWKTETNQIRDGLTFNTKQEQYFNPNGSLLQTKKYGNNTAPIVTDYGYTSFNEIQSESISTAGITLDATTLYEYDSTNRYLKKTTFPSGNFKDSNVDFLGRVHSIDNHIGSIIQTTSYVFDKWGNVKESTDYLGLKTRITRIIPSNMPAGSYSISTKKDGEAESISTYDKFDRLISTKTQAINNEWIYKSFAYDIFGKKTQESEPYFANEDPMWNTIEYDEINRPIKQTTFNGKIITTCYEGLKVSVQDGTVKEIAKWIDGTGNVVKSKDKGGEIFYKYYPNGSLKETNYEGIKISYTIDGWGNKTGMVDPSSGTYSYVYDNLSRITSETTPKGNTTKYTYDNLGRLETEITDPNSNTHIFKTYSYDPNTKLPTTISGDFSGRNYSYTTYYDPINLRITGKREQTPEFIYTSTITYDDNAFGRVDLTQLTITLPSLQGISSTSTIKNIYDTNGILIEQRNNDTNTSIWKLKNINSHGLTTRMIYGNENGNGYEINTSYDDTTLALTNINHKNLNGGTAILDIDYEYDINREVLNRRNNKTFIKNETYTYDDLDRLLEERVNNVLSQAYTFDKRGRMTSNTDIGIYNYNDTDYKLQSVNYNSNGANLESQRGFAEINYNLSESPNEIKLQQHDFLNYDFSILKTRSVCYYGSTDPNQTLRPNRKFYSSDMSIEVIKESSNIKIITYVNGDPYSANYIKIDQFANGSTTSISSNNYFLHRDNQGTILAITQDNTAGTLIEKRYFDAWGNLKGATFGSNTTIIPPNGLGWINNLLIDRGYTGHEHLKTIGLIHMNGRIYDPVLRRFLSPDKYVQDISNTQNYNRYGYVYNNPLLYTDPSGEIAQIVIGIAIAIIMNGINNMTHGVPFWYGMGKSGFIGAISGVISTGIGDVADDAFENTASKAVFQAGMHGVSGGLINVMDGGKFGSGFAAGAVSSLVSSGVEYLNESSDIFGNNKTLYSAVMITSGGFSGGLSSSIAGGDFWDGMRQGLITSGLNHAMHIGDGDNGYDTDGNKISNKGGDTTDYLYDKNGNLLKTTAVSCIGTDWSGMITLNGSTPKLTMRGFGVKSYLATGAINEDNTILEWYAGGQVLNLAGKGINFITGGSYQWIRFGRSHSIVGDYETISLRWGAGGKHWKKIGSKYLQNLNKRLRETKISFDSWRTADPGHFHFWRKKE